ncbi:MAG TPA: hypothetical protein PKD92_02730 [Novosphingobium sp.]|nr:hypothetical protein [Novosphingobium sp.]
MKEPGIQGDVPAGATGWKYQCGVNLLAEVPRVGSVQGYGTCAYVRAAGMVHVIDVSDPGKPVEVGSVPVKSASETMRTNISADRALLVSGSSVYDISDCRNPKLKGEIKWPPLSVGVNPPYGGGGGRGLLPHDLRISRDGTKVYGSLGLWQVDISNLDDPETWTVTDLRCEVLAQVPGPWQAPHQATQKVGASLCDDAANPAGAGWRIGGSDLQSAVLWGQISHGIDVSADNRRVFVADQAASVIGAMADNQPRLHVIDVSQRPVKVLGSTNGPGHSMDWFTRRGREYVVHANEVGTSAAAMLRQMAAAQAAQAGPSGAGTPPRSISALAASAVNMLSDTCRPYPRPSALGWAFEAFITDVSQPTRPRNLSMLQIAINNPEHCEARKASGRDPTVAYHMLDNAMDAKFAAVNFGSAGLRIFDIRNPARPYEVAYFNHGPMVHGGVGYYDAARGLIYAAGGTGLWILELQPQVMARLGL